MRASFLLLLLLCHSYSLVSCVFFYICYSLLASYAGGVVASNDVVLVLTDVVFYFLLGVALL